MPAQVGPTDQVQVSPPQIRRAEPPAINASVTELEQRGDELRAEKSYLDALDYYQAALAKKPEPTVYNRMGIAELQMQRLRESEKRFERAIHADHNFADAYNNLGVVYYEEKGYRKAIKLYLRAIELRGDVASYYSNLGAAYFSKNEIEKAAAGIPTGFGIGSGRVGEDFSHGRDRPTGVAWGPRLLQLRHGQTYAKMGATDRSLEYLRKAMEEGYKGIDDVYKDAEFAGVRKDPRFVALMTAHPPGIPE